MLDSGAHVAGDELDEVLRFVGGGAAEEIEEEAEFGDGAAGFGEGGERGFDVGEGESRGCRRVAIKEVGGGGAEVAVAAVGGGHGFRGGTGELGYGFAEE